MFSHPVKLACFLFGFLLNAGLNIHVAHNNERLYTLPVLKITAVQWSLTLATAFLTAE